MILKSPHLPPAAFSCAAFFFVCSPTEPPPHAVSASVALARTAARRRCRARRCRLCRCRTVVPFFGRPRDGGRGVVLSGPESFAVPGLVIRPALAERATSSAHVCPWRGCRSRPRRDQRRCAPPG